MDITTFSEDSFDGVDWINSTFKANEEENKENVVSSMISKLQLYVQQLNCAIEDTSQELILNMPNITKDAQKLQQDALSLRSTMSSVQEEISEVQSETGSCMAALEKLDASKVQLEQAKQALEESDSWGHLNAELEDCLERRDTAAACDKLNSLQKSLIAQKNLAGGSEREVQIEDFKNRLEAMTSPAIVLCLSSGDAEESKKYLNIFLNMNRLNQFKHYYRTLQKNSLRRFWAEISETVENHSNEHFMKEFYDFLLENFVKQNKWCKQVFPNENEGMLETILVISELLTTLEPTRETLVTNSLKRSHEKLDLLMEISTANINFATALKKRIEASEYIVPAQQKQQLEDALFSYFNVFIVQYANIEQSHLNSQLEELNILQPTASETIRALENSIDKIFEWSRASMERCENITQNCAIISLLFILNTFYKSFLEKYKKSQQQLEASRSNHQQDWNLFQLCISLLQNIGSFKIKLQEIDASIKFVLITKEKQMEDLEWVGYKIVGKRDLNDFKKILKRIKGSDGNNLIFDNLTESIDTLCKEVHNTVLANVFSPIEGFFKKIEIHEASTDLPDFSLAPLEYITQVGQYLLTLPQGLEPLLLSPSDPLKLALDLSEISYKDSIAADILLKLVAEECSALYQEKIHQIFTLNSSAAKQLATDIEYFGSVLEELGLSLGTHLQQTSVLLKAPADSYLTSTTGIDARLVATIRQMRNITFE